MKNVLHFTICLFIYVLQGFHPLMGSSQNLKSVYETEIDLALNNVSLKTALKAIEEKTGYSFAYDEEVLSNKKHIRIDFQGQARPVSDYLIKISKESNLHFHQVNNLITIRHISKNEDIQDLRLEIQIKEIVIKGRVTDKSDNSPLPGVSIIEKGTSNGTITDLEGNYTINVDDQSTLVFSFVGFVSQEIPVGNSNVINLEMESDIQQLQELVVVGYGRQRKMDITGSVASINLDDVEKTSSNNVLEALQGRIAGLDITTNNNSPGAEESFLIRGTNSLSASNSPLIILDGVPYYGSFNDINPSDISSVEVLKDASSAAIYGSRASNGVILITTRRGKTGKPKINYSARFGIQDLDSRTLEMMDIDGYINKTKEFARQQFGDPELWKDVLLDFMVENYESGNITNWVDDMVHPNAPQHEHTLSISGANDNSNYFTSLNYFKEKGVFEGSEIERISGRINFDYDISNYISAGTRLQVTRIDNGGFTADFITARRLSPFANYYEDDGETLAMYPFGNGIQGLGHPKAYSTYDTRKSIRNQLFSNLYLELRAPFLNGLSYRINAGYTLRNNDDAQYRTRNGRVGLFTGGTATIGDQTQNNLLVENIIKYQKTFKDHDLDLTLLYSRESQTLEASDIRGQGFANDLLLYHAIQTAEELSGSSSFSEWTMASYMARLNYSFNSKYLITMTMRRDGFSGFGADRKWGIFPSAAVGWNLSEESFMQGIELINNLKLRASYGLNGNQAVGAYAALASIGSKPYTFGDGGQTFPGVIPTSLPNPNLGWESTESLNVGIDFGILNNRLSGSLDYYNSKTNDLLLRRTIPATNGFNSILQNIGETANYGVEVTLSSENIRKNDFNWSSNFNIFLNRNKIVSLYGSNEDDDIANGWFIGQPIRVAYDYKITGLWQESEEEDISNSPQPTALPGYPKLLDFNGDTVITAEDRFIQGRIDPDFIAGLTNTFRYKSFDLTIVLHGKFGGLATNDVYRYFSFLGGAEGTDRNFPLYNFFDIDYWTPDNPDAEAPAIYTPTHYTLANFWENPSFVRVEQVSIGYNMPQGLLNKLPFERLRIYLTGRNLFAFTKFVGDPELVSNIDYPMTRVINLGVNVSL